MPICNELNVFEESYFVNFECKEMFYIRTKEKLCKSTKFRGQFIINLVYQVFLILKNFTCMIPVKHTEMNIYTVLRWVGYNSNLNRPNC